MNTKRKREYIEYLQSKEWFGIREKAFEFHGRICSKCSSEMNLQIHHLRYPKILGHEDIEKDLCVLCGRCHSATHGVLFVPFKQQTGIVYEYWLKAYEAIAKDRKIEETVQAKVMIAMFSYVLGDHERGDLLVSQIEPIWEALFAGVRSLSRVTVEKRQRLSIPKPVGQITTSKELP